LGDVKMKTKSRKQKAEMGLRAQQLAGFLLSAFSISAFAF